MKIFDCHLHIEEGLLNYNLDNVAKRNVIFNSIDSYEKHVARVPKSDSISLIFDYKNNLDYVLDKIDANQINALKIHSREQELMQSDYPKLIDKLRLVKKNIPIIIDAFYYDHHLENRPSLSSIIDIAQEFPKRKIIVAHSGGHKILDYFFHLRTLDNIYYDLSLSLQYLSDSSCFLDLIKLIKYTNKNKILFGTDYHWADAKFQFEVLISIFDKLNLNQKEKQQILYDNSEALFFDFTSK
jgi:hypothetical protein